MEEKTLTKEECGFGYRDSNFKTNGLIILEVLFTGVPNARPQTLQEDSSEILQKRQEKYPPNTKCPGSFFKNVITEDLDPETLKKVESYTTQFGKVPAGALIDAVGGKGDTEGNVKIAENHGNTFINTGNASAEEFYNMVKKYYEKVKAEFGIELESEVQLINLPPINT